MKKVSKLFQAGADEMTDISAYYHQFQDKVNEGKESVCSGETEEKVCLLSRKEGGVDGFDTDLSQKTATKQHS